MAGSFHIEIVTPERKAYEGTAVSLVAPAAFGYLGVLAHHAPLMATLAPGKITVRDTAGNTVAFASKGGGFLQVSDNTAVVLADAIEPAAPPQAQARKETR